MHKENEDLQKGTPVVWHLAFVTPHNFIIGKFALDTHTVEFLLKEHP